MKLLIGAFLILGVTNVFAENKGGLFIEPFISYESSDLEVNYPSPFGESEFDYKGAGVGTRLGFHIYESVFIGGDARYGKYSFNDEENNYEEDASGYTYGPVVGFQLPTDLKIRVWYTYVMGGVLDPEKADNLDVKFEDAKGHRIGAGLAYKSFSFNLEYQDITYDKTELESVGPFSSGSSFSDVELDNAGYVFSVSFPVAI
jgi:hypothetical protein